MGFLPAAAAAADPAAPSLWVSGLTPEPYDPVKIGPYINNLVRGRSSFFSHDMDFAIAPSSNSDDWAVAAATGTPALANVAGRIGVLTLPTGASATGRCMISHGSLGLGAGPYIVGGGKLRLGWLINITSLSTAAERFTVRAGLGERDGGVEDGTNGITFRYVENVLAGNWQAVCRAASVETTADSGIAVAIGWVFLEIEANDAGTSIDFYVNLVKVATIAANIPLVGTALRCGIQKNVGTGNRNIQADFAYSLQRLAPDRIPV